jgi:hypothetical protein
MPRPDNHLTSPGPTKIIASSGGNFDITATHSPNQRPAMFSPSIGRVVRTPGTIPTPAACSFSRITSAQQTLARPTGHQRRLSSSKPSIPPHGSKGPNSAQQSQPAGSSRASSGKKKRVTAPPAPTMKVPVVPPTRHLENPRKCSFVYLSIVNGIFCALWMSNVQSLPNIQGLAWHDAVIGWETAYLQSRAHP